MNYFLKVVVLSFILLSSCKQAPDIKGHWRRLDMIEKQTSASADKQYGDLIMADDSTFTMVGNDSLPSSNIPGWHVGGTMNGKWKVEGKNLYLYISDVRVPVTFSVIRLTNSDLQFQSNFANSPLIEYKRVD